MIKLTLTGAGYQVVQAANGAGGLAKAHVHPVHMVLTDLNMPVMDGFSLIRELRMLPAFLGVPIILLTTESDAAMAAVEHVCARSWLILVLTVAGSLLAPAVVGTWLALGISRRLSRTVGQANAVARGDLGQNIVASGGDEVRALIDALNRMTANLRASATIAEAIAGGDLSETAARQSDKDVLGIALEQMLDKLREVVADASSASENVSSGSQELSENAGELSQSVTEQASTCEEASASMEQMAANIKQNADNAGQTEKIAQQSAKDAEASGTAVDQAVTAMRTIAEKITIVQEIARQTDLLALNAAVKAARAGEHGRGFEVVASEVRKLAERSQSAATEIGAVSSQTVQAAQQAGEMLARLVPDIKKTAELVAEISAACCDQDVGAEQINQAIQQLDNVTQQNASSSEQMSATSEELAAQAEQLQAAIGFFHTGQDGASAGPHTTAPRHPVRSAPVYAVPMHGVRTHGAQTHGTIEKRPPARHQPPRRVACNGHDAGAGKPQRSQVTASRSISRARTAMHDAEFVRY
jgi:methyl-accepting chemotaxis protein